MYYSAGNYEAFAHPQKPEGVDKKSAYIIGTGLAGLSAAFYLVRDGQMKGEHVHVLEKLALPGGSTDGIHDPNKGFIMRGGREMDNHFEVMWDVFRDVPSCDNPEVSVLDDYYWLNKKDPNYSLCRATLNRGQDAKTGHDFTLDSAAQKELTKLFLTPEKDLEDMRIDQIFDDHFWKSNFWLYWQTMFAFETWSSALEMKRYLQRYVHHIDGLPDFSALRFTKYNQYDSMILPLMNYLKSHHVQFDFGIDVKNVIFDTSNKDHKVAKKIIYVKDGVESSIDLVEDDLIFITNGCCTDSTCYGDQTHAPDLSKLKNGSGESWDMWKAIAAQDDSFGHPDKFCGDISKSNWMSATITTLDEAVIPYIVKICKRDPHSGKVVTGGIVTVKDSLDGWYCSWTINRQPQFLDQSNQQVCVWFYGLFTDRPGNFIKKPMKECTGIEIAEEWLYHIGVPLEEIPELASKHCNTTTSYLPYINAFFMPRKQEDRPLVVPHGAVNFAFIGQFAEIPHDTIFTTEYSMRSGMEGVYTLLNIDRGVPEVWGSRYDVRELLRATYYAIDRKPISSLKLSPVEKLVLKKALKKVKGTDVEQLLKESKLID
jgi:oleate hydratase